ncbi:MAG: hypothetical protein ACSHX8_08580 [Opitutaceae bacterium]
MKKIRPTIKSLKNRKPVFEDESGTKVFCIGENQYAIQLDRKKMPICAFESKDFGSLLKKYGHEVRHVNITKYNCVMCACKGELLDVHLHLKHEEITIENKGRIMRSTEIDL